MHPAAAAAAHAALDAQLPPRYGDDSECASEDQGSLGDGSESSRKGLQMRSTEREERGGGEPAELRGALAQSKSVASWSTRQGRSKGADKRRQVIRPERLVAVTSASFLGLAHAHDADTPRRPRPARGNICRCCAPLCRSWRRVRHHRWLPPRLLENAGLAIDIPKMPPA